MSNIFKGQIIEFIEPDLATRLFRVIWVHPQQEYVGLFDILNIEAMPEIVPYQALDIQLQDGNAHLLDIDPYRYVAFLKPGPHETRRDRCFDSIQDLVENHLEELFDPTSRGPLIRAAKEKYGTSKTQILKRLRRYWARGMIPNTMLPDFRPPPKNAQVPVHVGSGRPGEDKPDKDRRRGRARALDRASKKRGDYKVTSKDKEQLHRGYKLYHLEKKYPVPKAYQLTMENLFKTGYDFDPQNKVFVPVLPDAFLLPSQDQFEYWGERLHDEQQRRRARFRNPRKIPLHDRPVLGDATSQIQGPGFEFQIDSTIADIYLVSARDRTRIIGRPVLYMVVDTFSRLIVGFAVTLEGPSWRSAMGALETVTKDKVALCAKYGIPIDEYDWRCHHLCQWLLADRGELISDNAKNMIAGLGIRLSHTPPYRPDWKPVVERNFGLVNTGTIKWQPGAVYERIERGGPDYRLDATLTLNEFRRLIILHILEHNTTHRMDWYPMSKAMVSDHVAPYPADIWAWGVKNQGGSLREERDQLKITANLIPEEKATITNSGIEYEGLLYEPTSPELMWKVQQAREHRIPIKVIPAPNTTHEIYVRLDGGRTIETCFLTDRHKVYDNYDWYEIKDETELKLQNRETNANDQNTKKARLQAMREETEENAEALKPDTSRMSKASRTGKIKENRRSEKEYERQQDSSSTRTSQEADDTALGSDSKSDGQNSGTQLDSNREILERLKARNRK